MKVNFETEHLMIRPLVPDDADAAFCWCGDPNVNTYIGRRKQRCEKKSTN